MIKFKQNSWLKHIYEYWSKENNEKWYWKIFV